MTCCYYCLLISLFVRIKDLYYFDCILVDKEA